MLLSQVCYFFKTAKSLIAGIVISYVGKGGVCYLLRLSELDILSRCKRWS